MSRLQPPKLPPLPSNADREKVDLYRELQRWGQGVADQVNMVSEGRIAGHYNSDSATPTSTVIQFNQGDFVWNNKPTEITATNSSYTVLGWSCEIGGKPGTWREARIKTGN